MEHSAGFEIETIQAGQLCRAFDGTQTVAIADSVQISLRDGERVLASGLCTPEQAMVLAGSIAKAAGHLISQERDDAGKPTSFLHRLRRLNAPPTPQAPAPAPPSAVDPAFDPHHLWYFLPLGATDKLPTNREHITDTPTGAIYRWPIATTLHMDTLWRTHSSRANAERAAARHAGAAL